MVPMDEQFEIYFLIQNNFLPILDVFQNVIGNII